MKNKYSLEEWIRDDAKKQVEAVRDAHDLKINRYIEKSICRRGLTGSSAKRNIIGSTPIIDSLDMLVITAVVISFILGYIACKYQYLG